MLQNALMTNYGRSLFTDMDLLAAGDSKEEEDKGEQEEQEEEDKDDDDSTSDYHVFKALNQLRQLLDSPIISPDTNNSSSSSSRSSLPMYSVKAVSDRLGISGVGACLPVWELSNPKYR